MMQSFINRWSSFVVNSRKWVILFVVLFSAIAIYPMKNLYYDNSNELFFLPGDPTLKKFDRLLELFGDNEYLSIGIEAGKNDKTVFQPEALKIIGEITTFMEDHETVTKVSSLTRYQVTHSEDDVLTTDYLIEDLEALDESPENMERLTQVMEKEKIVHGSLISRDFKNTIVVARTQYIKGNSDHKIKLINDLNGFLKDKNYGDRGYKIYIFGSALIEEQFYSITTFDQSWSNPMLSIVIITALFVFFRTFASMFFPWIVIGTSALWVIGIQGLLVWGFNSVLTALPAILIIIGVGDSVHIITEYYSIRRQGAGSKEAAMESIRELWLPCFYTSLTTAMGFIALSVTELVPIKNWEFLGPPAL